MSQEKDPTPSANPPPAKKTAKPHRWRRRGLWTLGIVAALALLLRILAVALLPAVLRHVAGEYGMTASYDHLELYFFAGDAGIWHFQLAPKEGGKPIVATSYARLDLSSYRLLLGQLDLFRLEAENVDLELERKADGTIPLLKTFLSQSPGGTTAATPAKNIDFTSPLRIDAFRLTNIHAHIVDESATPRLDTTIHCNLMLTDLNSLWRPAQLTLDVAASPYMDVLHVEGTGTGNGKILDATVKVEMRGLHPRPLAGYLAPFGLNPVARYIAVTMDAGVKTDASPSDPNGVSAHINVGNIVATVDGQAAGTVKQLQIDADAVDFANAKISQILLDGASVQAWRTPQGTLGGLGFELVKPTTRASKVETPTVFHWSVGKLRVHNASAGFVDHAVAPAAKLGINVANLSLGAMASDMQAASVPFTGDFTAPGLADTLHAQGQVTPGGDVKSADLQFAISGIHANAIQPYLDPLGLGVIYKNGSLAGSLHAQAAVDDTGKVHDGQFVLSDLVLKDPGQGKDNLLDVSKVAINGAAYDPKENRLSLDTITISGPRLTGSHLLDGSFTVLGLRTQKPVLAMPLVDENGAPIHVPPSSPWGLADYPKLKIGKLTWKNAGALFTDRAANTTLQVDDAGVELANLSLDLSQQTLLTEPGTLHAWLTSPGAAGMLDMTGTITPHPDGAAISVIVNGQQLAPWRFVPYLPKLPFAFTLQNGGLYLEATTVLHLNGDGLGGSLDVKHFSFKDGNEELLGVDALAIPKFTYAGDKLQVDKLQVLAPQFHVVRDADGAILTCGIMMPANNIKTAATQPTTEPSHFVISLPELDVQNAGVWLDDLAVSPAASVHVVAALNVKNLAYSTDTMAPCPVQIELHEDSAIDHFAAQGSIVPSPTDPSAMLQLSGEGLRIGKFAAYLPPRMTVDLTGGRFSAALDAAAHIDKDHWVSGHVYLNDLRYADFNDSLAQFKSLRLAASHVALDGEGPIALEEFSVDDLQTTITMTKDRVIHALGISLGEKRAAANAPAPPFVPAPAVAAVTAGQLAQNLSWKHPLFMLDKLDIQLGKVTLDDQADLGKPIILSHFHLVSPGQIKLLGDEYWNCPPMDLKITGGMEPLLQFAEITAQITPFAVPAGLILDGKFTGIHGQGITDLLPALQKELDGSALTDGVLTCHLEASLDQKRINPLKLDLSKPFDLSFDVKPLQVTTAGGTQKLAGVEEIAASHVHIAPADSTLIIKTLAISNPAITVYRDAVGIHAAGLTLKIPGTTPTTKLATPPTLVATAPAAPPTSEVRIDRLLITGLDCRAEDRLVDPPLVVPLTGLDFEARNLSTRLPYEDKSVKFTLLLNSGSVPVRNSKTGVTENRDVFSQIGANGLLSLYPKPKGWIKTNVDGLDLTSLASEAKAFGINLRNGVFDSQVDIKMNGDGWLDTNDHFSVTDLDISEADHGPVQKFLKLAVGLNGLIPVITDDTNAITVPAKIRINANDISDIDGIGGSIGGAIMSVFTKAVAAAPAKLLGLTDSKRKPVPPVVVTFRPGAASVSAEDAAALANLTQQMREHNELVVTLRTDLTDSDITVVSALANPSHEYLQQMATQLRADGWQLFRAHVETKEKAQAQLATGSNESASPALVELHQIDRQIAANQDALDDVYALLAPGADKQAPRRTKRASLQLGEGRLQAVLDLLTAAQIPNAVNRIKLTHATAKPTPGVAAGTVTVTPTWQKKQD